MVYHREAQMKYKANNLERYLDITRKASLKYKHANIELVREKDRIYKANKRLFITEWNNFRNIDLF